MKRVRKPACQQGMSEMMPSGTVSCSPHASPCSSREGGSAARQGPRGLFRHIHFGLQDSCSWLRALGAVTARSRQEPSGPADQQTKVPHIQALHRPGEEAVWTWGSGMAPEGRRNSPRALEDSSRVHGRRNRPCTAAWGPSSSEKAARHRGGAQGESCTVGYRPPGCWHLLERRWQSGRVPQ